MPQFSRTTLALVLSTSLLAACGGGGSGGTPTAATPVSNAPVFTSANYTAVAATAWASSDSFTTNTDKLNTGGTVGGGARAASLPDQANTIANAANQLARSFPVLNQSFSEACPSGGSMSGHLSMNTTRTLSSGGKFDFSGNNCVVDSVSFNGKLAMDINISSGGNLDTTLVFSSLTMGNGGDKVMMDGDSKLLLNNGKTTVSGTRLKMTVTRDGKQLYDRTLSNYSYSYGQTAANSMSLNGSVTTTHSTLGSINFNVQTTNSFITSTSGYPQSGSMLVSSGGSTVKLTALGGNAIKVELSEKGDGVINQTQTLTYEQLKALQ